jgi:hypothetical protein
MTSRDQGGRDVAKRGKEAVIRPTNNHYLRHMRSLASDSRRPEPGIKQRTAAMGRCEGTTSRFHLTLLTSGQFRIADGSQPSFSTRD